MRIRVALEQTRAHGVVCKSPKTQASIRDITLPDIVVGVLREHRRQQLEERMAQGLGKLPDNALVFPAPDGGYQKPSNFSTSWNYAVGSLRLPTVTWHGLRHTHASMLIDANVNIKTISSRLGHANPSVTLRVYAHIFKENDRAAADAINAAVARWR